MTCLLYVESDTFSFKGKGLYWILCKQGAFSVFNVSTRVMSKEGSLDLNICVVAWYESVEFFCESNCGTVDTYCSAKVYSVSSCDTDSFSVSGCSEAGTGRDSIYALVLTF